MRTLKAVYYFKFAGIILGFLKTIQFLVHLAAEIFLFLVLYMSIF